MIFNVYGILGVTYIYEIMFSIYVSFSSPLPPYLFLSLIFNSEKEMQGRECLEENKRVNDKRYMVNPSVTILSLTN